MSTTITPIDCQYLFPEFAASYLLENRGEAAFVDNNTYHSVPRLLEALRAQGLHPEQVKYLFVTHVHLDHAGGTAELLKHCPHAQVVAHPRAARHLIDPSKLVASARAVYGEARFDQLYGKIEPIAAERVTVAEEGDRFKLGQEEILILHTRGHANHHFCLWLEKERVVFSGDSFGLSYPGLQKSGRVFVFPSTSPTDFDFGEALKTVERIRALQPKYVYPTHFGPIREVEKAADQLIQHLNASEAIRQAISVGALPREQGAVLAALKKHYKEFAAQHLFQWTDSEWKLMELDLTLNADGLIFRAERCPTPV